MGADHNIHQPFAQSLQGLFLLGRGAETAHHLDPYRKILHPLDKGIVMLLGQNGCRHQVNHLLTVLNCLKGRTQSHLCLSVAHVSADQPIHDLRAFHIFLYRFNGI